MQGYSLSEYIRESERFGERAVLASVEQWQEGNSETPFRLCEAFRKEFVQEDREGRNDENRNARCDSRRGSSLLPRP
jgi:hypothetical protein